MRAARVVRFSAQSALARLYATLPKETLAARYESNGDPSQVIKLVREPVKAPGSGEVTVKFLFSPIHPADLNMVQGHYPNSPKTPTIGGSEGVARIIQVGSGVKGLKEGDLVVPAKPALGTWRTYATLKDVDLMTVPHAEGVKTEYLVTLSVNPASALRMLNDFVDLKAGDVVIQNGANSMVGVSAFQIAHARGIKTINIIRRGRTDYNELVERMKNYGAYMVVGDDYLRTNEFRELIADLPRPKLALNCVGGPSATEMARLLAPGGTMVTYGGMALKPVTVPPSLLLFNDIRLHGFWLSKWYEQNGTESRTAMFEELVRMAQDKTLRLWTESHTFQEKHFERALHRAMNSNTRDRKVLLEFE